MFERVVAPIHQALAAAGMQASELDQIIIIGGGVRFVCCMQAVACIFIYFCGSIPKIQEILLKTLGIEDLGKNLNGDEAAALGLPRTSMVLTWS